MGGWWARCLQMLDDFWRLEEPPRKGALADCVAGSAFHAFFTAVVAANAGVIVYFADQTIQDVVSGAATEAGGAREKRGADACFLLLFIVEAVCKLAVHRWFYFWNEDAAWNWLDAILILDGLTVFCVGTIRSTGALRLFRFCKVARILRVCRVFRVITELRLLFTIIVGSTMHLFWSIVLLAALFFTFSLYFTSSVADYLQQIGTTADSGENQREYFGSIGTSMWTLFITVFCGVDWRDFYYALRAMDGGGSNLFLFFIVFVQLSLLNIVTSFFVDQAMKLSQPDVLQLAEDRANEEREHANELQNLLALADRNQKGHADKDALDDMIRDGRIISYLNYLNIDPMWSKKNLGYIFDELAERTPGQDESGVPITAIVDRIMAVRGFARCTEIKDLVAMVQQVQGLQQQIMSKIDRTGDECD
jgi:voltage-gated sodium channel